MMMSPLELAVRRARMLRPLKIEPKPAATPPVRIIEIVNGRQKFPPPPKPPRLEEVLLPIPSAFAHLPTVNEVLLIVAAEYGIKSRDLCSRNRQAVLVRQRHVAMYLATHLCGRSLPEVGRQMGFDHSSVIHGRDKVVLRLKTEPGLAETIERMKVQIGHRVSIRNGGVK